MPRCTPLVFGILPNVWRLGLDSSTTETIALLLLVSLAALLWARPRGRSKRSRAVGGCSPWTTAQVAPP